MFVDDALRACLMLAAPDIMTQDHHRCVPRHAYRERQRHVLCRTTLFRLFSLYEDLSFQTGRRYCIGSKALQRCSVTTPVFPRGSCANEDAHLVHDGNTRRVVAAAPLLPTLNHLPYCFCYQHYITGCRTGRCQDCSQLLLCWCCR